MFKKVKSLVLDAEPQAVATMLARWFFDVLDSTSLDSLQWWDRLDKWRASDKKDLVFQASRFLDELIQILEDVVDLCKESNKAGLLLRMVKYFTTFEPKKSRGPHAEVEGYFDFIQALQGIIWNRLPVICFIGGHASGDMFGIGATALLKDDMGIVVYEYQDLGQDHADQMVDFFTSLITGKRVKRAQLGKVKMGNTSKRRELIDEIKIDTIFDLMEAMGTFCWLAPYNMGTYFLMRRFRLENKVDPRNVIRCGFQVDRKEIDPGIIKFVELKTLPIKQLCQRRVLVLWSRFSGKKGDYHPEHDTSFRGMAQLVWMATELGYYVILAGDKPLVHNMVEDREKRARRYDIICDAVKLHYKEPRCFNLTEFWQGGEWKELQATRIMQFRVYELLHRFCDVRHLGMRSGNLEAIALLGYFMRYMEEEGSWGGPRMMTWHGTDIGYERILLKEPPTRVGKHLQKDRVTNNVTNAYIPNYVYERNRGLPNTSSKFEKTVDALFVPKLDKLKLKVKFAPQPTSELFPNPNPSQLQVLAVQQSALNLIEAMRMYREIEKLGEKLQDIKGLESGFLLDDLFNIASELLLPPNPRTQLVCNLLPEPSQSKEEKIVEEPSEQEMIRRKVGEVLARLLERKDK
ncbi:MAG: hypothetical protein QM820_10025 [Minicystis sp.]